MATPDERQWVWNQKVPTAVAKCIHVSIQEQAVARPDAVAVYAWDGQFTYRELDRLATRLSCRLISLGVSAEVMVPICFEKSRWAIVAMLGVLKAGGAFVPLDPSQAASRREGVLAQTKANLVLTSSRHASIMSGAQRTVLPISSHALEGVAPPEGEPATSFHGSSLAYVIFTSGSTGQPKGVAVEHRALATSCFYHGKAIGFDEQMRMLQFTSYTFDVSIMEIFTTLLHGGCVCVPSDADRFNNLEAAMQRMSVNTASITPSVARLLQTDKISCLQTLVLGGENVTESDLLRWKHLPRIVNGYGPTECTVFCSLHPIGEASQGRESCIGRAVGSVSWVVASDDHNQLAPIGAIGELLVEGPILARGYVDDAEKTAASFIEDPPWLLKGGRRGRLYKTGDLVRYNEDGSLLYLGRKDNQVKIRGQRVELGEVEHHVKACIGGVGQVAAEVIVPSGEGASPTLAAFLTLDASRNTNAPSIINISDEAQRRLEEILPAYMIPSVYFEVYELPINSSGKTDRQGLRAMGSGFTVQQLARMRSGPRAQKRAPSNDAESALLHIWSRVLNLDPASIGVDDSFFRLGGDSISAMQASAAARVAKIDVSTADILRKKTISLIAEKAAGRRLLGLGASAPVGPADDGHAHRDHEPFSLSPIQQLYINSTPDPTQPFDQIFLLSLGRTVSLDALDEALRTIVKRHPMLRARFSQTGDGTWEQRITDDVSGSLHLTHSCDAREEVERELVMLRCRSMLNIKSGPLVGAVLFEGDDDDDTPSQSLFVAVQHLIIDLVSWRVLFEELEQILTGAELPEVQTETTTTSFRSWCAMQAEYVAAEMKSDTVQVNPPLLSYWGIDHEHPPGSPVEHHVSLDEDTTAAILGTCNEAFGTRPVELLLASLLYSFGLAFADHGRAPPTVFVESHGREPWDDSIDISRTVGWFTTMFPITAEPTGDLLEMVRYTKDWVRALPNNGWTYFTSRFAAEARAQANAQGFPAEIMFNYAGSYQQFERDGSLLRSVSLSDGRNPDCFSLIDVVARVQGGRLVSTILHPDNIHHQDKIAIWAAGFQAAIQSLASLLPSRPPEWTVIDFPMAFNSLHDIQEFRAHLLPRLGILSPRDVEDIYPCTPVQEGILVAQVKDPLTYRPTIEFEIVASQDESPVHLDHIEQAWRAVVRRHSLLRALFVEGVPGSSRTIHVILRDPEPSISRGVAPSSPAVSVGYQRAGLQHHLSMQQTDPHRVLLCLEVSHAIADGYSLNLVLRDFELAYRGRLHPSGPPYGDFIKYVESRSRHEDRLFWEAYFDGVEPCLFPPSVREHHDEILKVPVPELASDDLHAFCARWEVTVASIVQTAWALVLSAYTGSMMPCFGNMTSGRDVPIAEVHDIFGPLIGMVPCRIKLEGQRSVVETLRDVNKEYIDSLPHQTYSLMEIHRAMGVGKSGLFNTILSFQKGASDAVTDLGNGHTLRIKGGQDPVEYDISINATHGNSGLAIQLDIKRSLMAPQHATWVARAFGSAIHSIINGPNKEILQVSMLGELDATQLWSWSHKIPAAVDRCVHSLVEEQTRARPHAVAVCAWDGEFTYSEVDGLANELAKRLVEVGVGPDVLVPLLFEKSKWAIVAMLAVLKARGAIVSLDPSHAAERRERILAQTGALVVMTSAQYHKATAAEHPGRTIIVVDSANTSSACDDWISLPEDPSSMAHVMFTSGSTGQPKGVVLEHRAVATTCAYNWTRMGCGIDTRTLQFSSYTFDASIWEIFGTLAHGGCVCVPSDDQRLGATEEVIQGMGVNLAILTPTVSRLLEPSRVPTLRSIVLTGEGGKDQDFSRWDRAFNGYGPTECTMCSLHTFDGSSRAKSWASSASCIGTPIGSVYWVVIPGHYNQLAPIGAIGELLMEGPVLARGYLGDAQRTAASFIEDPPWLLTGAANYPGRRGRLYKTGDLVRYNEDGSLLYLGRKDTQVKIRGQRVELGEVEHHVKACIGGVDQVAAEVIVPSGEGASPMLVAFMSCPSEPKHNTPAQVQVVTVPDEAKRRLAESLPAYMIPVIYFQMHKLPINSSGKTDRRSLRSIGSGFTIEQLAELRSGSRGQKQAPNTDMERALANIWSIVLHLDVDSIGIDDNFFHLGGDSVAAMKLVAEARRESLSLSVADVFRHPQLSTMSRQLILQESNRDKMEAFSLLGGNRTVRARIAAACRLSVHSIQDAYPCTPLQEGLLALTSKSPGAYTMRAVLTLKGDVDTKRFRQAWIQVARLLPILRTRIVNDKQLGLVQAVVSEDVQWSTGHDLSTFLSQDASEPMELGQPLCRYAFITNNKNTWFILTLHHALYDGEFLQTIPQLANDIYRGESLQPRFQEFNSFVRYIDALDRKAIDGYWRSTFAGYDSAPFPAQKPNEVVKSVMERQMTLPDIKETGITSASLVRAAWALTVAASHGSPDVVFGATVSGRQANVPGIEDIAGPTIATVPVRIRVKPTQSVMSFLSEVQEQSVDMIPYEQTGLRRIQEICGEGSQFQTLLVIQPQQGAGGIQGLDQGWGHWTSDAREQDFASYALNLVFSLDSRGAELRAIFDNSIISESALESLLQRFESVASQLACAGSLTVADIDVVSESDYQRIWSWNRAVPQAVNKCVHTSIGEQAIIRPEAVALCAWDGELTYGQLDALSSRLASRLVDLGVGPEVMVPLLFEKSKWAVVAMLGVLKAGGAIVPLDPSQARERRERILFQINAPLVLTSVQHALSASSAPHGRAVIVSKDSMAQLMQAHGTNDLPSAHPQSAAYVLFTSGSTGEPKGVVVEHRAIATSTHHFASRLLVDASIRMLQFAAYTFDASILETTVSLVYGGCLCIPSDQQRIEDTEGAIHSLRANAVIVTPTVSRLLQPHRLPSLTTVVMAGEAATDQDFARWAHIPLTVNAYGPTECAVCCAANTSSSIPGLGASIGTAVGSTSWVVASHDHNRLAPIGAIGELLIEGPILARGYLGDAQRTAASFIENPPWLLRAGRQGRLYKTGDLVRYNNDGTLTYMGRKDAQVKIRGQRVELGEVEHHLRETIPGIVRVTAQVIVLGGEGSSPMLAAFLTFNASRDATSPRVIHISDEARGHLQDRLPVYMIPSVYFELDYLPMSTSGKTDRKRLEAIGATFTMQELVEVRRGPQGQKRAPSTDTERALANIWSIVLHLNVDSIGIDDNFFHLGGDSVAAMKLVAEARRESLSLSVANVFRHPRLSSLSRTLTQGKNKIDKMEAFALLDNDQTVRTRIAVACRVSIHSLQDAYPCTPLQEGLLALTSKSPGAYTMRAVLTLEADVDMKRFRQAWIQVARQLPILRTRVVQDECFGLVQAVVNEDIKWSTGHDLSTFLSQDASKPMGLGEPLCRCALIANKKSTWFILTLHHALYDREFLQKIPQLAGALYRGDLLGQESRIDFSYFVRYTREINADRTNDYWQSIFTGYDSTPFPAQPGETANAVLEQQLSLPHMKETGITSASLVRAAWALTVAASHGSPDVVFGATVSGRQANVPGIEDIAGPTIATVPVRIRVKPTQSVMSFLSEVQEQSVDMIPYEQTGLRRIREICGEASQFQTLLVIQPRRGEGVDVMHHQDVFGRWTSDAERGDFSTYALNLVFTLDTDGANVRAVFDDTIISKSALESLLQRFESVASQLAYAGSLTVADIDVVSESDYQRIWSWNRAIPQAVEKCIHISIKEQATTRPDAVALCAWDGELTYNQLDALSSRLASQLVKLGVGPEVMVPLLFEKSKWAVVAMLAVLKAGGAFVPLDPSQGTDRRGRILSQIKAKVILVSTLYSPTLFLDKIVLPVGSDLEGMQDEEGPLVSITGSLAYVIFTSGSTGQPKGVAVEHRALATSCFCHGQAIGFDEQMRMLQFTSYTFDVSVMEIFTTLLYGGCVCVPSDADRFNDIEGAMHALEVNCASLTPSLARLLQPDKVPCLRTIVLGGENVTESDWRRWSNLPRIVNGYGPTECTVFCSLNTIDTASQGQESCIGRAIGSVSWVVASDNHNRLVPIGAIGELLVEGPILARGYVDDAAKTAASFIENPPWLLKSDRQGRLYKTGDLVKYGDDGTLTYIGRKDAQVKIRGQRVELGEVEHHLRQTIPNVVQVAAEVVVPSGDGASPTLAAFLTFDASRDIQAPRILTISDEAQRRLEEILPAYMIPSVYVIIQELPINSSGKTDRRSLRAIGSSFTTQQLADIRSGPRAQKRAPSTDTEKMLLHIWSRVLNLDATSIGVLDSFLGLGGDSISAMQVSAAARAANINISTGDILGKKTIALLAQKALENHRITSTPVAAVPQDHHQPFDLSPVQQLYVHLESDPTRCFDQCFFLKLASKVSLGALQTALEIITERHAMLRARFSRAGNGTWRQRIVDDVSGSFCLHALGGPAWTTTFDDGDTALHIQSCRERLDIENGPLMAAVVFEEADAQRLFISIHHLAVDLVSWRIILQDLEALLVVGGQPPTLPPPTTSFQTWCAMQAEYAANHLDSQTTESPPNVPPCYWGIDDTANVQGATAEHHFTLDKATTEAIVGSCNEAFGTRPVELMMAALFHSFQLAFDHRPLPALFVEGHGREPWDAGIDVSRTVGWFTTMFPVHGPATTPDLLHTICHTKDSFRMQPNNGWSHFTRLFSSKAKAEANALSFPVEVMFNYAGSYQQLERDGSLFRNLPLPSPTGECSPASVAGLRRFALFDVFAEMDRGRLAVTLVYPDKALHQEGIAAWARHYDTTLRQIASTLSGREPKLTLADFPGAFATYESLDALQARLRPQLGTAGVREIQDMYPCTPVQERILDLQARDPKRYRVELGLEIRGSKGKPVVLSRIERAWQAVVRRHSLLRAVIVECTYGDARRRMHVILKDPSPSISQVHGKLSSPLEHHLIVRLMDDDTAYLELHINHAIFDGYSADVLLHDLRLAYSHDSLDPNGPPYRDFVDYQQQQRQRQDSKATSREFWTSYLRRVKPCLIPKSEDAPQGQTGTLQAHISNIDAAEVHAFCARWDMTPATVIQTAWAMVLYQATGMTCPSFVNIASGRDVPVRGVADMFGPLMCQLPCRVDLGRPQAVFVLDVLRQVQQDFILSLSHKAISLAEIQDALHMGSGQELCNTAISFQKLATHIPQATGESESIRIRDGRDPVEWDIYIRAVISASELRIALEFWQHAISTSAATQLAESLGRALSSIIRASETTTLFNTLNIII